MRLWKVQMIIAVHWPKHLLIHHNFHFGFVSYIYSHAHTTVLTIHFPHSFVFFAAYSNSVFLNEITHWKPKKAIPTESKCVCTVCSRSYAWSHSPYSMAHPSTFRICIYARIYTFVCAVLCSEHKVVVFEIPYSSRYNNWIGNGNTWKWFNL